MYDYIRGKKNILSILNSITDVSEKNTIADLDNETEGKLTFQNGIRGWITAIFIDIVDSSNLFKNKKDKTVAKIIRAFSSEIIEILDNTELFRQIGIRGDCVFAVYSTPLKNDIDEIFNMAVEINTLSDMLNALLTKQNFPNIEYGIGLGCSKDLVIKVGKKKIVNDIVYIGDAVVNASNLAGKAKRDSISAIAMDSCVYRNILENEKKDNPKFESWIIKEFKKNAYNYPTDEVDFYHCSVIKINFSKWINQGMKNEQ